MLGRICVFVAVCAAIALSAAIQPEQADARSSVAAAAVHSCSVVAAHSHGSGARSLSSAQVSKASRYCNQAKPHISGLRFWYSKKHRWMLYLNQSNKKCWQARLQGPLRLCIEARAAVRHHTKVLARLDAKIKPLLPQPKLTHDGLYNAFLCIHGGEGAWNDATGNGYYGGLQMDLSFQSSYGSDFIRRWGTANNWPPWAQIIAAERAYRAGRGFGPWPQTGPPCASRFM